MSISRELSLNAFGGAVARADLSDPLIDVVGKEEARTAAHCAGHAAAAVVCGLELRCIGLWEGVDGHWEGFVRWSHPEFAVAEAEVSSRMRRRACRQVLTALLSGRAAELLGGFGWLGAIFTLDYAAPDTVEALMLCETISAKAPLRVLAACSRRAARLAQQPPMACAINTVAEVLLEDGFMSGETATSVVRSFIDPGAEIRARQR